MFRTYEPRRDRLVAVKVFLLDLLPEQAKELAEELQGLVEIGLDHPSIVLPLSAGLEGHTVYLAEEHVAAESLDIALRHLAPAPVRKALPLLRQLAGALDFARARGVGHGALHPRDVFVAPEIVKATGFGVVQALERLDVRPPVRRPYSAPERMAGGEWSTPADVYALAAVAHELLTGKRPAGTGEVGSIPGTVAEFASDQVRGVLRRALAEDQEARYQNGKAFVDALDAALRGETLEGVSPVDRVDRPPLEGRELAVELDVDAERHEESGEFDRNLVDEGARIPVQISDRFGSEPIEEALLHEEAVFEPEFVAAAPEEPLHKVAPDEGGAAGLQEQGLQEQEEEPRAEEQAEAEPWLFDVGDEGAREAASRPAEATPEAVKLDEATLEPQAVSSVETGAMIESYERRRPTMVSFGAVALVFLVAGFLAGYGIGGRQARQAVTAPPPPSPSPSVAQPSQQAWSEAAVESPKPKTPVVVPSPEPPVPAESAAPPAVNVPPGRTVSPGATSSRPAPPPGAAEARRAPAPPVVGTGLLVADSRPAGARVLLDGRLIGKTPLKLTNVKAGPHTVRLEMAG